METASSPRDCDDTALRLFDCAARDRAEPRLSKNEALEYVKSHMKMDDMRVLRDSNDNILKITNPDLSFSMKSLQTVLDTTAVTAPDVANLKPQDLVDLSLIDEIKASGFVQNLYKS